MRCIKWEARFSVGNDFIDDQHKVIIGHINKFSEAARFQNWDKCNKVLSKLLEFVEKHFKDEEEIMDMINFDGLAAHKMIHKKLMENASILARNFKDNPSEETSIKINHFLNFWIKSHICGIDMNYKSDLKKAADNLGGALLHPN